MLTPVLCIGALWIAATLAVDPRGGFPVTDDWAFAVPVRSLVEEGQLRFSDWTSMNLIVQALWGSLFASAFGTGHDVLRVSTLVAGFFGGWAFYGLLRLARIGAAAAFLLTLTLIFNPIYFNLAFSFMTDVPYTAMQVIAFYLLAAGLLRGDRLRIALGWLAALAAQLIRQIAVAIPAGLLAERLARRPFSPRALLIPAAAVLLFVAIQAAYELTIRAAGVAPALLGRQSGDIVPQLLSQPIGETAERAGLYLAIGFFYFGLFCLPATLLSIPPAIALLPPDWRRASLVGVAVLSGLLTVLLLARDTVFPMTGVIINPTGLGADLVGPRQPLWASVILTALSSAGGILLLCCLAAAFEHWRRDRERERFDLGVFGLATGACLFLPILFVELRWDRYLLPVLPCVILGLERLLRQVRVTKRTLAAPLAASLLLGGYAVAGTHDYIEAKRVQWQAYGQLLRQVPPDIVDAGWALNGAALYGRYGSPSLPRGWIRSADFVVETAPGARDGYRIIAVRPVRRWLPWGRNTHPVIVQQRSAAVPAQRR